MESTNYMNPKYWLIGVGAVNLLFSLYNFFDASGVAEIALTDHYGALSDRELAIATAYEEGWGLFGIPYGILAIGAGLVLDSDGQAKMALVSGLAFIATFPILLYVSGTNNYSVPIEQFAPVSDVDFKKLDEKAARIDKLKRQGVSTQARPARKI